MQSINTAILSCDIATTIELVITQQCRNIHCNITNTNNCYAIKWVEAEVEMPKVAIAVAVEVVITIVEGITQIIKATRMRKLETNYPTTCFMSVRQNRQMILSQLMSI